MAQFQFLYWILYYIIHGIPSFLERVRGVWVLIEQILLKKDKQDLSQVAGKLCKLSKLPQHIGLLIQEEETRLEELGSLCKVVCWCIAAEIHCITIFDAKGFFKQQSKQMKAELKKQMEILFGSSCPSYNLKISSLSSSQHFNFPSKKSLENSFSLSDFNVEIISLEDTRWNIVQVAKNYCEFIEGTQNSERGSSETTQKQELSKDIIRANLCLADKIDPDLVLNIGSLDTVQCLRGFLPWHIHTTEFKQTKQLKDFYFIDFFECLQKYAGSVQRYGQ